MTDVLRACYNHIRFTDVVNLEGVRPSVRPSVRHSVSIILLVQFQLFFCLSRSDSTAACLSVNPPVRVPVYLSVKPVFRNTGPDVILEVRA